MVPADLLCVGVWNLEKQATRLLRGLAQAEQLLQQDADVWLLTEYRPTCTWTTTRCTSGHHGPGA